MDNITSDLATLIASRDFYYDIATKALNLISNTKDLESIAEEVQECMELSDMASDMISEIDMKIRDLIQTASEICIADECLNDVYKISYNPTISKSNNIDIIRNISKMINMQVEIVTVN